MAHQSLCFRQLLWFLLLWRLRCSIVGATKATSSASTRIFSDHHYAPSKRRLRVSNLSQNNDKPISDVAATKTIRQEMSLLRIRGGSTTSNANATQKRSRKQSSVTKKRSSSAKPRSLHDNSSIFQLRPVSDHDIRVQAILSDRIMSWKTLGRILLGILAASFLQRCGQTAGMPRRQAIWSYLKESNLLEGSTADTPPIAPPDFQPSPLDCFLAKTLAKAANDLIPPSAMPQGRPLLGAILTSVAFILCTVLLPHWVLSVQVWFDYHQQQLPNNSNQRQSSSGKPSPTAVLIHVNHNQNNPQDQQDQALCKLYPTSLRAQLEQDMPPFYFEHGHRRYYFDPATNQCWEGGPNLHLSVSILMQQSRRSSAKSKSTNQKQQSTTNNDKGGSSKFVGLLNKPSQLLHAQDRWYAYNHQTSVPIPTIVQALWERLKSPLVVVQLIGKAMAVLEEGKGAFLSLGQTVFQHYHNARKSILASRTLQQDVAGLAEEFATTPVWIYRNAHWKQLVASDLLPGDLFLLPPPSHSSSTENDKVVPVDALLLDGLCVTMEAVLTGESVPQTKMPLESTTPEWNQTLDMEGAHRSAVLFAGTTLLHCAPPLGQKPNGKSGPPPGVLCLALRTGSYSSKGELISALASSRTLSGAATISNPQFDKDALRLITAMSIVTLLACTSLFWKPAGGDAGVPRKTISGFRRTIQCTRIATACIPSDLPLALSAVVQSCANVLREEADVVCSQPGALLTASQIDTVVLDKTGTITADTQSLSKIVTFSKTTKSKKGKRNAKRASQSKEEAAKAKQQSTMAKLVLAGCHSLVYLQGDTISPTNETATSESKSMIGDPLEQAALEFSGWSYDPEGGFYYPPGTGGILGGDLASVERLWQIKVFPFSPTVRLSSVICLTRHSNGEFKLWAVVKGAPEAVKRLLKGVEVSERSSNQATWFDRKVQRLESKGVRALALGAREMTVGNSTFLDAASASVDMESDIVAKAHAYAAHIHRSDIEGKGASASFYGFACFNAYTRPSSKRILRELKSGNVHSVMLTGDGMRSALAVASKVGMLSGVSEIAALEMSSDTTDSPQTNQLQWRLTSIDSSKKNDKVSTVSIKTIKRMLRSEKSGELALVASGDAIMNLLQNNRIEGHHKLLSNLNSFTVVARASPECKEKFVKAIRETGRRVLMCGDGVNDVSAMKEAEVSVALLNGFGAEQDRPDGKEKDVEDARRRQRIKCKVLGGPKNDLTTMKAALEQEGIGTSSAAAASRVKQNIEKAKERITRRVAERHGISLPSSEPLPYTMSDMKEMVSSIFSAVMEERRRAAKLKQGGGAAANILAEEDAFMKAGSRNGTLSSAEIRPGEACMASPFSCLRSSIDGVEAVLRAGVATAACALSVQQKIMLHSLMSCFNLSALYRDGFKYGKNMWTMEFLWYIMVDQASYTESTKMRPHLPRSTRPSAQSLFDASNILSVILQAGVHLITTEIGIRFGRNLEAAAGQPTRPRVIVRPAASQSSKMSVLLGALAKSKSTTQLVESDEETKNFLGQPKFIPNYETNIVFVLSVLQSTAVTMLLHKGKPFYPSILESRKLCLWSGFSVLFVVACILETFPLLNRWLELRSWESPQNKLILLVLATVDVLASACIEWVCRQRFRSMLVTTAAASGESTTIDKGRIHGHTAATAADEEEQVLNAEAKRNFQVVLAFAGAIAYLAVDAALKG